MLETRPRSSYKVALGRRWTNTNTYGALSSLAPSALYETLYMELPPRVTPM